MSSKKGYGAVHQWVRANFGKANHCEACGATTIPEGKKRWFEWSNKSGDYKREKEDWQQMCINCHIEYDIKYQGKPHIFPLAQNLKKPCDFCSKIISYHPFDLKFRKYKFCSYECCRNWKKGKKFGKTPNKITFNGETRTVPEWAKKLGILQETIYLRLKKGWTIERALQVRKNMNTTKCIIADCVRQAEVKFMCSPHRKKEIYWRDKSVQLTKKREILGE